MGDMSSPAFLAYWCSSHTMLGYFIPVATSGSVRGVGKGRGKNGRGKNASARKGACVEEGREGNELG